MKSRKPVFSSAAACALVSLGGLTFAAASPARAAHRDATPADSFLRHRVYSVEELVAQAQSDPVVRRRFARHFQIPESRVVSYMRANLVESYIPQTGRYTVYCIGRRGNIYATRQTFRRGTKVFALRNGQPVMKWLCGNPLSKFLPSLESRTTIKKVPVVQKTSPDIEEWTPADTADVWVPGEAALGTAAPVTTLVGAAPIQMFGGGGFSGASLLPALLLPLGLLSGGGGGAGPAVVPIAVVPEPGSVVYLLLALPAVGLWAVRRRAGRAA